jgi:hypothetical protein
MRGGPFLVTVTWSDTEALPDQPATCRGPVHPPTLIPMGAAAFAATPTEEVSIPTGIGGESWQSASARRQPPLGGQRAACGASRPVIPVD